MLKTPKFKSSIMELFYPGAIIELAPGMVMIEHFNLDHLVPSGYKTGPSFDEDKTDLYQFGVCDSFDQFLNKYEELLKNDERTFVISFTHIAKNPGEEYGWRWHKWGPYIGEGKPTTEYLADEPEFDAGVWVFRIIQTDGPVYEWNSKTSKFEAKVKPEPKVKETRPELIPRPPEELVDALQDRIHPSSGRLLASMPITKTKTKTKKKE